MAVVPALVAAYELGGPGLAVAAGAAVEVAVVGRWARGTMAAAAAAVPDLVGR